MNIVISGAGNCFIVYLEWTLMFHQIFSLVGLLTPVVLDRAHNLLPVSRVMTKDYSIKS